MTGPVLLRKGRSGESALLAAIGFASWQETVGRTAEFLAVHDSVRAAFPSTVTHEPERLVVIEQDGTVAGFGARKDATNEISDLWIGPTFRGQGLGGILLSALEAEILAEGFAAVFLDVHAQNASAIGFYRRQGYVVGESRLQASRSVPPVTYASLRMDKRLKRPRADHLADLQAVRAAIDAIDPEIVALIAERFTYIDRAAALKGPSGIPPNVPERVEAVVDKARTRAGAIGFDAAITEIVWRAMIDAAIDRETRLIGAEGAAK